MKEAYLEDLKTKLAQKFTEWGGPPNIQAKVLIRKSFVLWAIERALAGRPVEVVLEELQERMDEMARPAPHGSALPPRMPKSERYRHHFPHLSKDAYTDLYHQVHSLLYITPDLPEDPRDMDTHAVDIAAILPVTPEDVYEMITLLWPYRRKK